MRVQRLSDHPYAQAKVLISNDYIELQSYNTIVIRYDKIQKLIMYTGTYSNTTRKHMSWFLHEYIPQLSYRRLTQHESNEWLDLASLLAY